MKIEVSMMGEKKEVEMDDGATGETLISKFNLSPDGVILIANGRPIPYTEELEGIDKIKIVRVASGG